MEIVGKSDFNLGGETFSEVACSRERCFSLFRMRSRFSVKALLVLLIVVFLLGAGVGFLLLPGSTATRVIPAELRSTGKANELTCVFPQVLQKLPPTFGFVSWRYTIRASYDFGVAGSGMHNTFEANPPPTSTIMIAVGAPPGAKSVHFESTEGILEPYVMNICVRPLARNWIFKFPQELPKRLEDQTQK
jgi:hypothetical protein